MFEPFAIEKLSVTEVTDGADCLAKLWFKLNRPKPQKSVAAAFGISFHSAVEWFLKEQLKERTPTEKAFAERGIELFKSEAMDAKDDEVPLTTWESRMLTVCTVYYRNALPEIEPQVPEDLEYRFTVKTPAGFHLSGVIDVVEKERLIDHKTTGSNSLSARGFQYLAYQLPFKEVRTFAYYIVNYRGRFKKIEVKPTKEAIESFIKMTDRILSALRNGEVIGNPNSFLCSEKYCDFFNECPWGARFKLI